MQFIPKKFSTVCFGKLLKNLMMAIATAVTILNKKFYIVFPQSF
jgi:hypothetical protein